MLDRSGIVARLREIASLLELQGGSRFKVKAFRRGARTLEATRAPIETLIEEKRLTELPGIGVAIALQVEELHRTETSALLESLQAGLPRGVLELSQVAGIGLHALRLLHEAGINSIDDLKEGRLRGIKGFGEKKEKQILAGLEKYRAKGPELRLADGLRLAESIADDLAAIGQAHIAGALRRSAEVVSEISLLLVAEDPKTALSDAMKHPRFSSVESKNPCRMRLPDGVRVELSACTPEEFPVALLHATGDRAHVEALEQRPLVGAVTSERDLYRARGLGFVPPELREGGAILKEADRGDIELVTAADLRGIVHCHSTWSDGKHSIEEMARAAEARGAEFITITDHSPTAHYARGLDLDRLKQQWDEIDEVQERVGIRIIKGTEADILADGALDWPDDILERLDVVIASIHNRYRQDEEAMTKRLLRAMRHDVFKIWGHPLGRLVPSRPPIPCRVEEVLDALAQSRGAIEISGDTVRMDLEPRWARVASERGLTFVLSVDAHSMRELDNVRIAVGLARRAGIRREQVLNTRSAESFLRAVKPAS